MVQHGEQDLFLLLHVALEFTLHGLQVIGQAMGISGRWRGPSPPGAPGARVRVAAGGGARGGARASRWSVNSRTVALRQSRWPASARSPSAASSQATATWRQAAGPPLRAGSSCRRSRSRADGGGRGRSRRDAAPARSPRETVEQGQNRSWVETIVGERSAGCRTLPGVDMRALS